MTYSHNSVKNNIKMAVNTKSIKKSSTNGSAEAATHYKNGVGIRNNSPSPPASPTSSTFQLPLSPSSSSPSPAAVVNVTVAHSNSIASSTNFFNQQYFKSIESNRALSSSPPGSAMSSAASTSSNSSSCASYGRYSLGSSGYGSSYSSSNGGSFFANNNQRQRNNTQHQRRSPQQQSSDSDGGTYFSSKSTFFQQPQGVSSRRRHDSLNAIIVGNGSNANKQQQQRTPNQSPTTFLNINGSKAKTNIINGSASNPCSGRKKHTNNKFGNNRSPVFGGSNGNGGKISPTYTVPTALTHFAGSKCFDAPAPTELPTPPEHWKISAKEKLLKNKGVVQNTTAAAILNKGTDAEAIKKIQKPLAIATSSFRPALAMALGPALTCSGQMLKTSKRNLLEDFDTHNLKLLLNVQS